MNQEILYRYLKGDTTPQEDLQVAEWLEADPVANQKELDIVRFVFEGMELYGYDARAAIECPGSSISGMMSMQRSAA